MVTFYHNPRCSKSRQTLQLVQDHLGDSSSELEIVEYLKSPLDEQKLKKVIQYLGCSARDIIRTSEAEYKENNLSDKSLSEDDLIAAMVKMPKLMQRPIVIKGDKAAIGRPPEDVIAIL